MPIEEYKKISEVFDVDVYNAISLNTCVKERKVIGGPSPEVVKKHIQIIKDTLLKDKNE